MDQVEEGNLGLQLHNYPVKREKLQEPNVKMVGRKQEERFSYLSKGDSVVEEGMGLVDSGW